MAVGKLDGLKYASVIEEDGHISVDVEEVLGREVRPRHRELALDPYRPSKSRANEVLDQDAIDDLGQDRRIRPERREIDGGSPQL